MEYNYSTPENAVLSLETAFSNNDLEAVFESKDFVCEAVLTLKKVDIEATNDTIKETAELLKLSLIDNFNKNGFPDFTNVKRNFSDLYQLDENLFIIREDIIYPDGEQYSNDVYLSLKNSIWKIAMIIEAD